MQPSAFKVGGVVFSFLFLRWLWSLPGACCRYVNGLQRQLQLTHRRQPRARFPACAAYTLQLQAGAVICLEPRPVCTLAWLPASRPWPAACLRGRAVSEPRCASFCFWKTQPRPVAVGSPQTLPS